MIKSAIAVFAILSLTACGGSQYASSNARVAPTPIPVTPSAGALIHPQSETAPELVPLPFATGPIYSACQANGRKAASRVRCGCVQAVADQSLSAADQRRGVKYFGNPAALQEVRQSDNAGNERFWLAWKAYGQAAVTQCNSS